MPPECVAVAAQPMAAAPAVATHLAAALGGGVAVVSIALLGWWANRRDWQSRNSYLEDENQRLTESLRLALYARGEGR